jgi:hypothetical protein
VEDLAPLNQLTDPRVAPGIMERQYSFHDLG